MTVDAATFGGVARVRLPASAQAWPTLADVGRSLTGEVRVLVVRVASDPAVSAPAASAPAAATSAPAAATLAAGTRAAGRESALHCLAGPGLLSVAVAAGPITGVSLAVALGCDFRVFCDDASLAVVDDSVFGCLGRLADLVGYSRALELCLTGRRIGAAEAQAVGLVNVVAPGDQLDDAVDDLVAALLTTPRAAAAEMKAALSASVLAGRSRRTGVELAAAARLMRDDG